jgi:hypothetical protein
MRELATWTVYIAMSMSEEAKMRGLIKSLTDTTCSVILIPDIFTFNILQSRTEEVNGVPVVPLFDTLLMELIWYLREWRILFYLYLFYY